MWFDFAENQAKRRKQVFLKDWAEKLDQFLEFNERAVLEGAGTITKKLADQKAGAEYDVFVKKRRENREKEGERQYFRALETLVWGKK
nr:RhuM family protein [Ignatzschineria indica]